MFCRSFRLVYIPSLLAAGYGPPGDILVAVPLDFSAGVNKPNKAREEVSRGPR